MAFLGYAIIIGAMKSGTTTLHHILQQHPEIVAGVTKELNFFRPADRPNGIASAYEAMFPGLDKTRHAYTLDSSPNYTKSGPWKFTPSVIAQLPGKKRLIYVLRNPIERIDSHIAHNVAEGRWTAENWRKAHVVNVSAYARHLGNFESAGLLDDILLLDFAELAADPIGVAYRVHDFMGLPRVRPKSVQRKNLRKLNGHFLPPERVTELKQLLRNDVNKLIKHYRFEPAKSWAFELPAHRLRKPVSGNAVGTIASRGRNPFEHLRYSLGFLIGTEHGRVAEHFRRVEFPVPLAVHPRTEIAVAGAGTAPLAILGTAVHPELPHLDLQGIADHLGQSHLTRQQEVDKLVGRFALIQSGRDGDVKIQTDAIGMRSVFFSQSGDSVIAGSHARLVAEALRGETKIRRRPFRWGYPGMSTPYATVYQLPPNSDLLLSDGTLQRFFPKTALPEIGIEEAWDLAFDRARTTVRALAERRKLLVSLTGGLDSRTTLAAVRDSWPILLFFTYNRGDLKHRLDNAVAGDLSNLLGLRHIVVRYAPRGGDPAMLDILRANTFLSHQQGVACAYHERFGEGAFLHIRSNLLELFRSKLYVKPGKKRGLKDPCNAESMSALYSHSAKLTPERSGHVLPAFAHYIAASDYESTIGNASPWDLYFVEHRMGAWHSAAVLESDLSFDTVIAFNSREILRHFMGIPQEIRCSSPHLDEKMKALLPEVRDIPINPTRYTRRAAA